MADIVFHEASGTVNDMASEAFSFGTRLGLIFIVEAASLSLVSCVVLLAYITYSASVHTGQHRYAVTTPLHAYFISIMLSEIIQATGSIMDVRWAIDSGVNEGPYCAAQGIMKQIGDVSTALSTLAVAFHTFCAIVLRWRPKRPRLAAALVLALIWSIVIAIIIGTVFTHQGELEQYYGNTHYWCWITKRYEVQQYVLDYIFMWTTAFGNIMFYIPLALVIKGYITISGFKVKLRSKAERKQSLILTHAQVGGKNVDGIAMQMLFYPLVYTLTVLPIAVARFSAFNNKSVPFTYTVIADILFSLSGFFNAVLFRFTRPALMPRRESAQTLPTAFSLRSPAADHFSFRVRSPGGEQHSYIGHPSMVPARSPIGTLPDDSEIFHFESHSSEDNDIRSFPGSPKKVATPSFVSFRTAG